MRTNNPQAWLPIGQYVDVGQALAPWSHDAIGAAKRCTVGRIVDHLTFGVVVMFDGYPNTWDYTEREARGFSKLYKFD